MATPGTVPTHTLKTLIFFSPILATLNISSVSLHFLISLEPTLDSLNLLVLLNLLFCLTVKTLIWHS